MSVQPEIVPGDGVNVPEPEKMPDAALQRNKFYQYPTVGVTEAPTDGWKKSGVQVIPASELQEITDPKMITKNMQRKTAINFARNGAQKLWAGTVTIQPSAETGAHHHGHLESVIYIVSGRAKLRWGNKLEFEAEGGPGDFVFVPPYVPHQELNASDTEILHCVLCRSDGEAIAIPLPDIPLHGPSTNVPWTDPTHAYTIQGVTTDHTRANAGDHTHAEGGDHTHAEGDGHTHEDGTTHTH